MLVLFKIAREVLQGCRFKKEISKDEVFINETYHQNVSRKAKEATCDRPGNIECWYCSDCKKFFKDEALTTEISKDEVFINETGHQNVSHVKAKEATCDRPGNIECWYCSDCKKFFKDEALTTEISKNEVFINETGHQNVSHVKAKEATCDRPGNIECWYCYCKKFFKDADLKEEISKDEVFINETGHQNVSHVKAKEATCDRPGNIECWYCSDCKKFFKDEALTTEISKDEVFINETGHQNVSHVKAKEATCDRPGNIECWYCSDCKKFFKDEALTTEIGKKEVHQ